MKINKALFGILLLATILVNAGIVLAQTSSPQPDKSAPGLVNCGRQSKVSPLPANPTQQEITNYQNAQKANQCTIGDLILTIKDIINFLLSWSGLVAIFMVVISGFRMVFARGDSEAISSAKTSLSHAIIGFILILISFIILNFVVSLITGAGVPNPGSLNEAIHLIP